MSQIEIKNLTKKFIQGSNEIYAVNNVSMQIEKGGVLCGNVFPENRNQ